MSKYIAFVQHFCDEPLVARDRMQLHFTPIDIPFLQTFILPEIMKFGTNNVFLNCQNVLIITVLYTEIIILLQFKTIFITVECIFDMEVLNMCITYT